MLVPPRKRVWPSRSAKFSRTQGMNSKDGQLAKSKKQNGSERSGSRSMCSCSLSRVEVHILVGLVCWIDCRLSSPEFIPGRSGDGKGSLGRLS